MTPQDQTFPETDTHQIERVWVTEAGYKAVCLKVRFGRTGEPSGWHHRCGYVVLPAGHQLHGLKYNDKFMVHEDDLKQINVDKMSPFDLLLASDGVRTEQGKYRVRLGSMINVHGGITYSRTGDPGYLPVEAGEWVFGFDCAHHRDLEIEPYSQHPVDVERRARSESEGYQVVRTEEYVVSEAEGLAWQLMEVSKLVTEPAPVEVEPDGTAT